MKQFTKITVLGLVFALALGSANCKKDEKDDTGTMLLLLSLLNTSSCGKLDYSLGYFMAQVAPPAALAGVGGYPWSYESCKPTYSQNGSVTALISGISLSVSGGTSTVYTYTNGYLTKKVVTGKTKIPAGTAGYDLADSMISATSTSYPNCPSNRTGTSVKEVDAIATTTYTRDASNNVTTEETKYTCGGNDVTHVASNAYPIGYAKKVMTYNADNRILTLKYYLNSDYTYNGTSATTIHSSYNNTAGANPYATMDYTYTPSSGIPSTVKVVASSFYTSIDATTATAIKYAASTNPIDVVTWNFTATNGVLTAATYTEECSTVAASTNSASITLTSTIKALTTGTNCGTTLTGGTSYGLSTTAANQAKNTQNARTKTITLTQDTKNTNRLASYKIVTVTKTYTDGTTSGTVNKTTTSTATSTLSYDSSSRLDKIVTSTNTNTVNVPAVSCTAGLSPDAGTCDGTTTDTKTVTTFSYNGNGLGVFAGAETFSTATAEDAASNPTLWNVK